MLTADERRILERIQDRLLWLPRPAAAHPRPPPAEERVAGARRRAPVQLDLRPHPPHRALLQAPAPRRPDRGEAHGRADLLRDPGAPRPPPAGGAEGVPRARSGANPAALQP